MEIKGIEAEFISNLKGWTLHSNLLDVLMINPIKNGYKIGHFKHK